MAEPCSNFFAAERGVDLHKNKSRPIKIEPLPIEYLKLTPIFNACSLFSENGNILIVISFAKIIKKMPCRISIIPFKDKANLELFNIYIS
tara:strand:+ start:310 stop:579 length:270 start_codon:yes stop_codon:yes gene_type:complete